MLLLGGNFTTLIVLCEGLKNETPVVAVLVCVFIFETIYHKSRNKTQDMKKIIDRKTKLRLSRGLILLILPLSQETADHYPLPGWLTYVFVLK